MKAKKSWVTSLPQGLVDQSGWAFVGTLCFLSGSSYLAGLAESTTITQVLDPTWLRVWGGFLGLSGGLIVFSEWTMNRPLERLALRFLSLGLLMYVGWLLTAVPWQRAAMVVALALSFVGLAEIRIMVIKTLLKPLPVVIEETGQ